MSHQRSVKFVGPQAAFGIRLAQLLSQTRSGRVRAELLVDEDVLDALDGPTVVEERHADDQGRITRRKTFTPQGGTFFGQITLYAPTSEWTVAPPSDAEPEEAA